MTVGKGDDSGDVMPDMIGHLIPGRAGDDSGDVMSDVIGHQRFWLYL